MAHWFFLLDIAAFLFIHANCQITISDWTCGYGGYLTDKFRELYSDTNTIGFCKTSIAPLFGYWGMTIWVHFEQSFITFSELDIYTYVNNQSEDCITFDTYEYEFYYWHDCGKYTGDSSQLSETFTVGPTADEQTHFTIEFDSCKQNFNRCGTYVKDGVNVSFSCHCSNITVSCGGVINLNQNLLDQNKGACDTSDAPQYGTIGIYDANSESWVTEDLHGLVTSSRSDDCLNYNESNYTVYYIHDCNSYDADDGNHKIRDVFDLGIDEDSQIVVKIDNNCKELFANESYTCEKTSSSFTSLTLFDTVDFRCDQNTFAISISSFTLTQYNMIFNLFQHTNNWDLVLYTRNLSDFEIIDHGVTLIDDGISKSMVTMTTLYESDTFIVAWKTGNRYVTIVLPSGDPYIIVNRTCCHRISYVVVDPTSVDAYDDVTNDIMFADSNIYGVENKRALGISSLTDGNFVIVWSQKITLGSVRYHYYEVLFSIIDPSTNEFVVKEEIVATKLTVTSPESVVASIETGYFMISWVAYQWSGVIYRSDAEANEYAKIYDNDGVAITPALITSLGYDELIYDDVRYVSPHLVPLTQTNDDENYFLVITHCMNGGYRGCIRIYNRHGNVKTINGLTYFTRGVEDANSIRGMTELNDGSLMVFSYSVLDQVIKADLFEIEVINGDFLINWEIDDGSLSGVSKWIAKGDLTNTHDNQFAVSGSWPTIGCGMQLWMYGDKTDIDTDFAIPIVKLELKYHFGFGFVILFSIMFGVH